MIIQYIILCFGSFLLALIITPALRCVAIRNGTLDYPDERKLHKVAVPGIGGIAIVISFSIVMGLGYVLYGRGQNEPTQSLAGLSIGAMIISLVGIWDDLWVVKARNKLLGQFAAVLVLMPFGFIIRELNIPFVGVVAVRWELGLLFSLFWMTGIVNTINFIDGMDGLAAGVSITITSALFVLSVITGQLLMAAICLILAGSTLGFLRYNFHPASIFMGDCGAMFLGLILAAVSIKVIFQNPAINTNCLIPVLLFGLPIIDTSWAIVRRTIIRESPFKADCYHTHHRLLELGCTQRQAAVILYAISLLSISAGFIIYLVESDTLAVALSVIMLALALTGIGMLSHAVPLPPPDPGTPRYIRSMKKQ
jgi:UDP-GlcNAc:undecaprenyl-phosphate GlcNAc-1-phosphate transferase